MSSSDPKVFVLGLDGADWKILDHMIERGVMPTLKRMKEEGAWGKLNSTIPPMTCPAWISFGTGKNPGRFGVYYFTMKRKNSYREAPYFFVRDPHGDNFWDILSRKGKKVGIVNIPIMHKPQELNGFMICGFTTPNKNYRISTDEIKEGIASSIAYPPSVMEDLVENIGEYHIDPPEKYTPKWANMSVEARFRSFVKTMRIRKEALLHLMKSNEWDLMATDIMLTDRLSHELYQVISADGMKYDTTAGSNMRETIETIYAEVDGVIRDIREAAGDDCYFFIMSDHGFGNQTGKFAVNDWLIKNGYLFMKKSGAGQEKRKPPLKLRAYHLLSRISRKLKLSLIIERFMKLLPLKMRSTIPTPFVKFEIDDVDWSRTRVYYRSLGQLYVNLKGREPEGVVLEGEKNNLVDEVIEKMEKDSLEYFKDDKQLRILKAKEIYSGRYLKDAPDIYFDLGADDQKEFYAVDTQIGFGSIFMKDPAHMYGFHRQKGIFVLDHPDSEPGEHSDLNLIDICPTVLQLFDEEIPGDVDGRFLKEIFKQGSRISTVPERKGSTAERSRIDNAISGLKMKI
ncbi:MAG: alkaline phosphatase family protein [Candidatus Thermoplasmatota archaeon]|nr:alkaline phosphatase family protein [Candidatus Thermoplasmatota archaeon]